MGAGPGEFRRLKQLEEEENRQIKKLAADLSPDKQMLQACARKKVLKPAQKRQLAEHPEITR